MAFRPLNDNVLIRRLEAEEEPKGGFIFPDTAKEKRQEGQSLAARGASSVWRSTTRCCSASTPERKLRLTVKNCS